MATNRAHHFRASYRFRALVHPSQACLLATSAMLAIVTLGAAAPLVIFVVGEIVIVGVLPHLTWFRREVDEALQRRAREAAKVVRRGVLVRMSDVHRIEFERLEQLANDVRIHGGVGADSVDEWLGLRRLLGLYVRLAIAHRINDDSLSAIDHHQLVQQLVTLSSLRASAAPDLASWIDRRIAIARRRIALWEALRDELEQNDHRLATIGELIRWLSEQCAAVMSQPSASELEASLPGWETCGPTLAELSLLADRIGPVDVDAIELGRPIAPSEAREAREAGAEIVPLPLHASA